MYFKLFLPFAGVKVVCITMDEPLVIATGKLNLKGISRFHNLDHLWLFDRHELRRYDLAVYDKEDNSRNQSLCIKHLHVRLEASFELPIKCMETLDLYFVQKFYDESRWI